MNPYRFSIFPKPPKFPCCKSMMNKNPDLETLMNPCKFSIFPRPHLGVTPDPLNVDPAALEVGSLWLLVPEGPYTLLLWN